MREMGYRFHQQTIGKNEAGERTLAGPHPGGGSD
jgi:hypothetical protein